MKITINGVGITLNFNYAALTLVAKQWGLKGVGAVFVKIATGEVDDIEGCIDLILASIEANGPEKSGIDRNAVGDAVLKQNLVTVVIAAFQQAFPQPDAVEGNGSESEGKDKPAL